MGSVGYLAPRAFVNRYTAERMSSRQLKRLFVASIVGALLLIPCVYSFCFIRSLSGFSDAYASDWTSTFVIDHIRTSGVWPKGWDDLRDEYDRLATPSHYAWTFDELQSRVWLDFDADIDEVRSSDPPKTVFRLMSGKQISFNGDPNVLIREYLRTGNDPHRIESRIGRGR